MADVMTFAIMSSMKTATLTTRVDPVIKHQAEATLAPFGLTLSQAIDLFLHRLILDGGLPFDLRQPRYDAEVEAALREVDDMIARRAPMTGYATVDEMMDALESEPIDD